MEILLLAISVISLLTAVAMALVAWRLSRADRTRSAARIAALAAAAADDAANAAPPAAFTRSEEPLRPVVAAVSPATPARAVPAPSKAAAAPWAPARQAAPLGDTFLGSAAPPTAGGAQRGLAIAAAVLVVALAAGGYFTLFGGGSHAAAAGASARGAAPLELVSLRHERQGGRLTITGLVRNPAGGTAVEKLSAVAFVFDQQGAFVTSSTTDVDFTRLSPGDESPFVIAFDAPANVARYRVSFRDASGVVPHIDRRGQEPIARDTP